MTTPPTTRGPYRNAAEECAATTDARSALTPWALVAFVAVLVAFVAVLVVVAAISGRADRHDRSRAVVDAPRYHRAAVLWAAHAYPERVARAVCGMGHAGRAECVVTVDGVPPIRLRCGLVACVVEWAGGGR